MINVAINCRHLTKFSGGSIVLRRVLEALQQSNSLKVLRFRHVVPHNANILLNVMPPCSITTTKPQISYIHDIPLPNETITLKEKIYNRIMLPATIKMSDLVVVPTNFVAKHVLSQYPYRTGNVKVLPYPLDTAIYDGAARRYSVCQFLAHNNVKDKFILSVFSSGRWRKGADLVDNIYSHLPKRIQEKYSWIVVGNLARPSYYSSGICYVGNVGSDILLDLYKEASVVVVPSRYEGFGLPALEAAASGVDCVCTRQGGLLEAASPKAVFCEQDDYLAFATAITDMLDNGSGNSKEHYSHAANFSYSAFVRRIEEIIYGFFQ